MLTPTRILTIVPRITKKIMMKLGSRNRPFKVVACIYQAIFLNQNKWWCRWGDSNSHGSLHTPLKRTCLPVPPHRLTVIVILIFYFIVLSYVIFLWISHSPNKNAWFEYGVLVYFLLVIPITRRINITFHAILASLGLILLVGVASFSVL